MVDYLYVVEEVRQITRLAQLPIEMRTESTSEVLRVRAAVYSSLLNRANTQMLHMSLIAKAYENALELVERQALVMLEAAQASSS